MRKMRHWRSRIAALVICFAVAGCGHGGGALAGDNGNQSTAPGGGAHGAPGQDGSAGAKGAPAGNGPGGGNGGNGGARGAPIKIPSIVHTYGLTIPVVMNSLINGEPESVPPVIGLAAECGGQLCVTLKTKPGGTAEDDGNGITQCEFVGRTEPVDLGGVAQSGDTIWVLTGNLPCAPPSADGGSPGDGQAPDGGSPPADTGPSPADTGPSAADAGPSPADSTSP